MQNVLSLLAASLLLLKSALSIETGSSKLEILKEEAH